MVWRFVPIFILFVISLVGVSEAVQAQDSSKHLITLYDRGTTRVFLTNQETLGKALKLEDIQLDARDTVEPAVTQELIASHYNVNIYHARPVVVVDGATRIKTISPYQTAQQIAKDVGITIYDQDMTTLKPLTNFVNDGAGLELTIFRAKTMTLDLYGKTTEIRTQTNTVGDMLKENHIVLGDKGRVSLSVETPVSDGMKVRVWREGIQTVSIDQAIAFQGQLIYDTDQPIGYRVVRTKGLIGNRSITYQVEVKSGIELSRVEIANIITRRPTDQTEVIGLRNDGAGLTKSKGAQFWTDSKGISHRETYYDLNMSVVMQSCGQGGHYSIRPDGAKVDADGYIIVAGSFVNYPKCSIVETSLGPAKVYDTGGFAVRYPYGFDIATDWSNYNGI
jgi:uncharacterized protein YabE (DUF348 family)